MNEQRKSIVDRILREAGAPDLVNLLAARLTPTDLQSVLLEVSALRAASRRPTRVLDQYMHNRFVRPSPLDPAQIAEFDTVAFGLLPPGFETIELSPLAPFGASSSLGPVDQNKVVTTNRNTEVMSDSTNVLALESAVRRRFGARDMEIPPVRLAAHTRLVRAQLFSGPNNYAHFRVLALTTASRNRGGLDAEAECAFEQIDYFLRLFRDSKSLGYVVGPAHVVLTPFSDEGSALASEKLAPRLAELHPEVAVTQRPVDRTAGDYYRLVRIGIRVSNADGEEFGLFDGGFTDWTARLLGDRKEFFLIGGLGTERFLLLFRKLA